MSELVPKRYVSPLRQTQVALTQNTIMKAMAASLLEHGSAGDSPALIARIASISERTLYRHYPTKHDLWESFLDWVSNLVGISSYPQSEQELIAMIPVMFARFDEHDELIMACIDSKAWSTVWIQGRVGWKESVEKVVGKYDNGNVEMASQTGAVIQLLFSGITWRAMRNWGLSGDEAAEATVWAIQLLLRDLERRAADD